ncbi:DNA topoisomerase IV subunit B [Woodsholea maritima]|uniref:DNA topoisomerase IV subunit B n=1 Tax=Woodsholea maritima TaxID=240237 RepID=UPI00037E1B93|nr:DNA topoisomerase IV subunit B [Woodsholea maritima]
MSVDSQSDLFGAGQTPRQAEPAKPAKTPEPSSVPQAQAPASGPVAPDTGGAKPGYNASSIEVLEGLEPVRKRPGMYIGGTDDRALHHLFAEILDNSMDEAVAGWADRIEVHLDANGFLTVVDNGRGIPVDPHPKFPDKSALEVVLTTLHAGGKFSDKAYQTAGGLHGVGISVVNALSERVEIEVAREKTLWTQAYERGLPMGPVEKVGPAPNRRGTTVRFKPDPQIFGAKAHFKAARIFGMARAKAFLRRGVEIRWSCSPELVVGTDIPEKTTLCFPGGIADRLKEITHGRTLVTDIFADRIERDGRLGALEWALAFSADGFGDADGFCQSFCNTVPTPLGGTHEAGLRAALSKALRAYGELLNHKKAGLITPDDVMGGAGIMLSVFMKDPEFQGQTKERLATAEMARLVETAMRDPLDHWLAGNPKESQKLIDWAVDRAEERLKRKRDKEVKRQTASRRLRLPGKLADCSKTDAQGTEIFLVEGDSAGGSAKQARDRKTQAILPLRGKILNVASATPDKIAANQEISDLMLALGTHPGSRFNLEDLRYERVIIMCDADVDGAHIASLLATFFYKFTPELITAGRLYMAQPPLYRLTQGGKTLYAQDDAEKDHLLATGFKRGKVDIGRFKGLGEMTPVQLKSTTMNPQSRSLARVTIDALEKESTEALVETLMGRKPELRYQFIQQHAPDIAELDL